MIHLIMGLSLGLSVLTSASLWIGFQWRNDHQILLRSHAQQDIRALMETLVHDIRRANFQTNSTENFVLSAHQILFTVDRNDNSIQDNNDCSGFRLANKELQTKTSCQPVVWTTLIDPKFLQLLDLTFSLQCDNSAAAQGDLLLIELRNQSSTEKTPHTWQRHVRLRNLQVHSRPLSLSCSNFQS
jgi:hypothetical protein